MSAFKIYLGTTKKKITSIWYVYKNDLLMEKIRENASSEEKAKYIYDQDGLIKEIHWYERKQQGLQKKSRNH